MLSVAEFASSKWLCTLKETQLVCTTGSSLWDSYTIQRQEVVCCGKWRTVKILERFCNLSS